MSCAGGGLVCAVCGCCAGAELFDVADPTAATHAAATVTTRARLPRFIDEQYSAATARNESEVIGHVASAVVVF
jgi:hypothetical protein